MISHALPPFFGPTPPVQTKWRSSPPGSATRIPAGMSLGAYCRENFLPARYDLAAGSAGQYMVAAGLYCHAAAAAGYSPAVADVSVDSLRRFLAWYTPQVSAATANKKRSLLLSLWAAAAEESLCLPAEPAKIRRLREEKPEPEAWTLDQMQRLLAACRAEPAGQVYQALVRLAYETGLRLGPLWLARPEQLDPPGCLLRVPAAHQKTRREQHFELSAELAEVLAALGPPERARLLPFPFRHRRRLWWHLRAILRRAGLPATRRDLTHKLRRTHATQVCRALGLEAASRALGHTSQQVTRRYVDPRQLDAPDVLAALPPLAIAN